MGGVCIWMVAVLCWLVFPEDRVVTVFLTNMGNTPIRGVPMRMRRILLGLEEDERSLR